MIKYIHVAGTNGKSSVCAYIADSLIKAGKKTGKFTSPHVLDITERITIGNTPIPHKTLERLCPWYDSSNPLKTKQAGVFELLMNAALLYFTENNIEYAVIETGIGGLYDCTNTVNSRRGFCPIVSVITKIGRDHTELLGDTIEEIARHKAGIIKEGVPVVTDPTQPKAALSVIAETAAGKNSRLIIPDKSDNRFTLAMRGEFQKNNAAVAAAALRLIGIAPYFSETTLPARMEVIGHEPMIIVDAAHNPDGLREAEVFLDSLPNKNKVIIEGILPCKNYRDCAEEISQALNLARKLAGKDGVILVCGSFYLAEIVTGLIRG